MRLKRLLTINCNYKNERQLNDNARNFGLNFSIKRGLIWSRKTLRENWNSKSTIVFLREFISDSLNFFRFIFGKMCIGGFKSAFSKVTDVFIRMRKYNFSSTGKKLDQRKQSNWEDRWENALFLFSWRFG